MSRDHQRPLVEMRGPVQDRMEIIEPLARRRRVLDVGCVDAHRQHGTSASRLAAKGDLLFRGLAACAAELTGVDVDDEGVEILAREGHDVLCADAATMDLGRTFDVIVAGEIIEHVPNAGQFLANLRAHLDDDGVLILTTPNPFYAKQTYKIWRYRRPAVHDAHVAWYDPITLQQALERAGLLVDEGWWIQPRESLGKTWRRLFRRYFCHSFLFVAVKAQ